MIPPKIDFHLAHNINHSWTHKHAAGKGTPGFNTCSSTCTFCEARTNLYWRRAGNGPSSLGLLSAINIEETIWVHHYDGVRLSFLVITYLILIINHDHLCHLDDCIWDCSLADWEILVLWIFGLSLCFAQIKVPLAFFYSIHFYGTCQNVVEINWDCLGEKNSKLIKLFFFHEQPEKEGKPYKRDEICWI